MNDGIESFVGEEHPHRLRIFQIHADKAEACVGRTRRELVPCDIIFADAQRGKTSVFQFGVVVVIDVVESYNAVAPVEQPPAYCTADKPRSACYQKFHELLLSIDNVAIIMDGLPFISEGNYIHIYTNI